MAQLKRYNGTSWETIGGSKAPKNTHTQTTTDTYSCDYINNNTPTKIYQCNGYTLLDYQDLLDIIQKMYDDYTNNINSVVYISEAPEDERKGFYRIYEPSSGVYRLQQVYYGKIDKSSYNGESSLIGKFYFLRLSVSGGVVSITDFSDYDETTIDKYLSTTTNYGTTTYSPQYDGSPATKKYVDDSIVQSDWNQATTTAKDYIKNKPGIKSMSSKTHSDYNNNQNYLTTLSCFTWWNGAYNSSNSSNLTYAHQGTIQCKPTSLYDNGTGVTGNVPLSQTAANFSCLEIFFYATIGGKKIYNSTRVYSPNEKKVSLITANAQNNAMALSISLKTISGTTMTNDYNGTYMSFGAPGGTNEVYVYKVWGWK